MTQHVMQAREGILTGYLENCCTCTSTIFEMSKKFTEDWWREKPHKDGWFYERQPEQIRHQKLWKILTDFRAIMNRPVS